MGRLRWTDNSYIVENTFDRWATTAGENDEGIVLDLGYNDVARVALYLEPALRRLRFVTCKNIFIPLQYYYVGSDNEILLRRRVWTSGRIEPRPDFSLSDNDLSEFEKANKKSIPPVNKEFLQLAFQHFELSFETEHKPLAFLILMIALEIILQPGRQAKSITLARNAAKLLASGDLEGDTVFRELNNLYQTRNRIIHEGISSMRTEKGRESLVDETNLFRTRDYVRRVLTKAQELGKSKEDLSKLFGNSGL